MREGWTYKKLGDVCTSITDGSHNPPKGIEHSEYRMISSQNIFDDELRINDETVRFLTEEDHYKEDKRTRLSKDVVLLTIVGTIGRACVLKGTEGFITLQRSVSALHPSSEIYSRFLMHCLIGNRERLNQEAHGIAQRGIYLRQLSELEIPIPSLSEQQSIVAELDKINELINLKKAQLSDLDDFAQSIFYDMFGDLMVNDKGWEIKKLDEIAQIGDGLHGTPQYDNTGDCYFINGNNLGNGSIVITKDTKKVNEQEKEKYKIEFTNNTLLVSINGSIGKVAFYNNENIILGKSACYIILNEYINKVYIFNVLKNRYFLDYVSNEYTGTTIRNVSLRSMRNLPIPLPPLSLQQEFAKRIELIEQQKAQISSTIKDLETLLASRMQYWFD